MKKLVNIILALAAITFHNSCINEELAQDEPVSGIRVYSDWAETRTSHQSSNGVTSVSWVEGDKIGLFAENQYNLCYIAENSGSFSDFTASDVSLDAADGDKVFAYYPYEQWTDQDGKSFRLPLTQGQWSSVGMSGYDALYAEEAVSNDELNLKFKHVFSFLKITVPTERLVRDSESGYYVLRLVSNEMLSNIEGNFNIETKELDANCTTDVLYIIDEDITGKSNVTCTVAILPQTGDANISIYAWADNFSVENLLHTIDVPDSGLEAGKVYKLRIKKILPDYVDEYGVNHGPGVEIDGVVWAPVNCGYHETDFKYGKLYQWGRKYGQGYSDNNYTDVNVPAISDNITSFAGIQSRENKNVYFTGLWDYYVQNFTQSQLSLIWNAGTEMEPMKSQYDPCPDGWRIPLHSEYENLRQNYSELTEENSIPGYWFCGSVPYSMEANQVFLPLAGGRDFGQARDRNELGYYYSSKPGGFFGLYEDGPHMVNYSQYSLACSVRCVQDDSEYISQETILWEGEAIADDWNNQPYLLSDGGVELLNAGAQPGQKVCFYVEPLQSDWKVDIWEGHWGPVYLSVCSVGNDTDGGKFTEYDLDANGGKIELTLTQDILDTAYTQQWWGGTFLLSGDNLKCTKITLQ